MGQRETERLNEIILGAGLASAVCTAAELGVADHIQRLSFRHYDDELPGGPERTEAQFRALLARAGFELSSITPTATMVSIVEGRPVPR